MISLCRRSGDPQHSGGQHRPGWERTSSPTCRSSHMDPQWGAGRTGDRPGRGKPDRREIIRRIGSFHHPGTNFGQKNPFLSSKSPGGTRPDRTYCNIACRPWHFNTQAENHRTDSQLDATASTGVMVGMTNPPSHQAFHRGITKSAVKRKHPGFFHQFPFPEALDNLYPRYDGRRTQRLEEEQPWNTIFMPSCPA